MDQGQMRVDVNISVWDRRNLGICSPKVEVKNVAGARNVQEAIEYEFKRGANYLENKKRGNEVFFTSEARRYDAAEGKTVLMRIKSEDPDYRFFQDPDLPAYEITDERIEKGRKNLPELPYDGKKRITREFGLDIVDVKKIYQHPWSVDLFVELARQVDPELCFNWIY